MFFWNSLAFSMIQRMLAIWSLVPLPFLNPAWTSGSSQFTYCEAWLGEFWALLIGIMVIKYPFSLLLANFHILTIWMKVKMLVPQSWLTLCDLMDCSWPGFSDRGILQARMLGWSGLPFPSPGDLPDPGVEPGSVALQAYFLPSEPSGKPYYLDICL